MKKIFLSTAVVGLIAGTAVGQTHMPRCGIDAVRAHIALHQPELLTARQVAPVHELAMTTNDYGSVTIPVVFHFLLTEGQLMRLGGIAGIEQRIVSQVNALNEDFNAGNADSANIPDVFKPLYGNARIRFGLARRHHETGGAFAGYQLKVLAPGTDSTYDIFSGSAGSRYFCSDAKYNSAKGIAAWPTDRYLNVWVVRITENNREGVIGITTPPSFTERGEVLDRFPSEVGIVLSYGVVGRRSSLSDFFFQRELDRGRTLTHEMGHFFELDHIWGVQAGCNVDDGIADTPPQDDANYICPTFPKQNCTNSNGGEMFMNYMDYVNDGCMHMFTQGQVARMRQALAAGGRSHSLTQNPELTQWPSNITVDHALQTTLYVAPNPARGYTVIYPSAATGIPQQVSIWNMMGQQVKIVPLQEIQGGALRVDLSGVSAGIYTVRCQYAAEIISRKIVVQ